MSFGRRQPGPLSSLAHPPRPKCVWSSGEPQLALQLLPFGPSIYWIGELCYCALSLAAKFTMAMLLLYRGLTPEALAPGREVPVRACDSGLYGAMDAPLPAVCALCAR